MMTHSQLQQKLNEQIKESNILPQVVSVVLESTLNLDEDDYDGVWTLANILTGFSVVTHNPDMFCYSLLKTDILVIFFMQFIRLEQCYQCIQIIICIPLTIKQKLIILLC